MPERIIYFMFKPCEAEAESTTSVVWLKDAQFLITKENDNFIAATPALRLNMSEFDPRLKWPVTLIF